MFIGSHDGTACFHCGGGLKYWLPTDDSWKEYAAWFPLCVYVRYTKGPTFIRDCQNLRMSNRQRWGMVVVNGHMLPNNEVE